MVDELTMLKKNLIVSYSQEEVNPKFSAALMRALSQHMMLIINQRREDQGQNQLNQKEKVAQAKINNLQKKSTLISKLDIFNILADLFESTSEDSLESLFSLLEKRVFNGDLISSNQDGDKSKQDQNAMATILNMISRICKTIMRKLSVTHNTGFRGKVQKMIASVFPLAHPSGLNRFGHLNSKNQTLFEGEEELKQEIENSNNKNQQLGSISEYKIYKNFWILQKYLTNPFNIYNTAKLEFEEIYNEAISANNNFSSMAIEEQSSPNKIEQQMIDSINGDEEEGQVEENGDREDSMNIDEISNVGGISIRQRKGNESNLTQVISTIKDFIAKFMSQPLIVEKENAQILHKYPKYLSKFSLLNLQFKDYLFRETFLTQVLIFTQTILNPINQQQKKAFIVSDDEKKLIHNVESKVASLLKDAQSDLLGNNSKEKYTILGKRKSMNESIEMIIKRENNWAKWKENKCQNFEKPPSTEVKEKKRDQKRQDKLLRNPVFIQAKEKDLNWGKTGMHLRKYLRQPKESINMDGTSQNIKPADIPLMSDFLNPLLMDQDPDQCIEESYKQKHNQVFSWRFLRNVSYVDLVNFHGKVEVQKNFHKFEGNPETQAIIMYNSNKRKIIDLGEEIKNEENAAENGNNAPNNNNQDEANQANEADQSKKNNQDTEMKESDTNGTPGNSKANGEH